MKPFNFFTFQELTVHCGSDERYHSLDGVRFSNMLNLLNMVNTIRMSLGHKMYTTSVYRDVSHNAMVQGSKNSDHIKFLAMDFTCNTTDMRTVYKHIKSLVDDGEIEIGQCILYPKKNFIHISYPTSVHHNEFFEK